MKIVKRWIEIILTAIAGTALSMFLVLSGMTLIGAPVASLALWTLVPFAICAALIHMLSKRI